MSSWWLIFLWFCVKKDVKNLDWGTRMKIGMGICYCLQYMHNLNPPIPHSNVNSEVVYLTEEYTAKVSHKYTPWIDYFTLFIITKIVLIIIWFFWFDFSWEKFVFGQIFWKNQILLIILNTVSYLNTKTWKQMFMILALYCWNWYLENLLTQEMEDPSSNG